MLGRKHREIAHEARLRRLSQSELQLQGNACLFHLGRAIDGLRPDDLRSAQAELAVLSGVVDILLDGSAVRPSARR